MNAPDPARLSVEDVRRRLRDSRPLSPVPGHINPRTGRFCNTEGTLARGGQCPDGCDHADHYANDGHPECETPIEHGPQS